MPTLYFKNVKKNTRYKVIKIENGTITMENAEGVRFDEPYDKERFIKMGYVLEQGADVKADADE